MKNIIKKLGDVLTILLPVSALPVIYFLCGLRDLISFVVVYAIGNLVVQLLKGIFDAPRPRDSKEHVLYIHGYSHGDGESFLSGHAMSAALPAYYILFFVKPLWVCLPFLLLAWICAWTRVFVKAHWPLDVVSANLVAFFLNICFAYCVSVLEFYFIKGDHLCLVLEKEIKTLWKKKVITKNWINSLMN